MSTSQSQLPSTENSERIRQVGRKWTLPIAMLALIALAGFSVASSWDGANAWRFIAIAVLAGVTSAIVARSRMLDGFAILISITLGVGIVWLFTAWQADLLEGSSIERLKSYPELIYRALVRDEITGDNRQLTAESLISFTVWLVSWIGMWMLVRVEYLTLALLAPCGLILANQHFSNDTQPWVIVAMVGLVLFIIVGQRHASRANAWRRQQVPVSDSLTGRVLVTGLALSVVVSSVILASPQAWSQTVLQPLIERSVDRLESARLDAEYWFDDLLGMGTAPQNAGSYTDFSDGYSIGGPLSLTDEPEVLVRTETTSAPYLKARSYDSYTGRGWVSTTSGEFAEDAGEGRGTQELRYNPGWEVALSPDATNMRAATSIQVTPLSPDTSTIFTVDSFQSADVQTVVRMGWTNVSDAPMPLSINTLNQLPPDVQKVGSLLLQSDLSGNVTSWGPSATSDSMQIAIDQEVDSLAARGVEVKWTASPEGIVDTLYVTGRLPVFDDVEAVFRYQQTEQAGPTYSSTGLVSNASEAELIGAGQEYPDWVTDRYLDPGETTTDRTLELAQKIVGAETNPYQQSVLIEQWLRSTIVYDETVDAPPGDQDLVDYVLFDFQYGYCEHYSAAMAVMLRSLGVPARVVVGYAPGTFDSDSNGYIYRQNNAHAWTEVYFPGYGWIPFEPTANRPLGEFDLVPAEDGEVEELQTPEAEETVTTEPTAAISTPDVNVDNTQATPQPTESDELLQPPVVIESEGPGGPPRWLVATGVIAIAGAVLGVGIWLLWSWGLRGLTPVDGLMKRIRRVGSWLGVPSGPTTTPREYARRFDAAPGGISRPVKRITRAYEIEKFGPHAAREGIVNDAKNAWKDIRRTWFRLLRRK